MLLSSSDLGPCPRPAPPDDLTSSFLPRRQPRGCPVQGGVDSSMCIYHRSGTTVAEWGLCLPLYLHLVPAVINCEVLLCKTACIHPALFQMCLMVSVGRGRRRSDVQRQTPTGCHCLSAFVRLLSIPMWSPISVSVSGRAAGIRVGTRRAQLLERRLLPAVSTLGASGGNITRSSCDKSGRLH